MVLGAICTVGVVWFPADANMYGLGAVAAFALAALYAARGWWSMLRRRFRWVKLRRAWDALVSVALISLVGTGAWWTNQDIGDNSRTISLEVLSSDLVFLSVLVLACIHVIAAFRPRAWSRFLFGWLVRPGSSSIQLRHALNHVDAAHGWCSAALLAWLWLMADPRELGGGLGARIVSAGAVKLDNWAVPFVEQALLLLPLYLLLLVPATANAWTIASTRIGGKPIDTRVRQSVLQRSRPVFWTVPLLAALVATGPLMMIVGNQEVPPRIVLKSLVTNISQLSDLKPILDAEESASQAVDAAIADYRTPLSFRASDSEYDDADGRSFAAVETIAENSKVMRRLQASPIWEAQANAEIKTAQKAWKAAPEPEVASRPGILHTRFESVVTAWDAWVDRLHDAERAGASLILATMLIGTFVLIVAHQLLLVELPFWRGQTSWKARQCRMASRQVRRGQHARTESAVESLLQVAAARDAEKRANEIPVHTFAGFGGLVGKLLKAGAGAALATLLGAHGDTVTKLIFG
jgi:hypothetical protein